MKIHLASDIHNEFHEWTPPPVDADLVILAGDIHTKRRGPAWAKRSYPQPILMIGGNHEAYGDYLFANIAANRVQTGENLNYLEREYFIFGGIRFICATLWTDFELYRDSVRSMLTAQVAMNDYYLIRMKGLDDFNQKLLPSDTQNIHNQSVRFIVSQLEESSQPCIIVTHHAPSTRSIAFNYRHAILTSAYVSDLEHIINTYKPLMWLHGHTHTSFDYKIDSTRVVCNPRGYAPHDLNPNFDPQLILEI